MKGLNKVLPWALLAVAFVVLLQVNDPYAFQFMEQRHSFFADGGYMRYTLGQLGGLSLLLSDLVAQFFSIPFCGVVVNALLLTLSTWMTYKVFSKLSSMSGLVILSAVPGIAYAVQMSDMNFQYFGFIVHLVMLGILLGYMQVKGPWIRLACAVCGTVLLFYVSGAIAALFAASVLLIEVFRAPKTAAAFVLAPLAAFLCGIVAYHAGLAGSMRHVFTPHAYFTLRLRVGNSVWLSWSCWIIALAVACLSGLFKHSHKAVRIVTASLLSVLTVAECFFLVAGFTSRADVFFKDLSISASKGDWDHIIEKCGTIPMNNLLYHNYLNVALAEKGLLAERLFKEPVQSIRSIYVETNKTPYVSVMLSDVFYSMGHMGLAQRYAFEGNEGWGTYSPRMYRRLVITNMAYGEYKVASKYISLLKSNPMHRSWAIAHEKMLGDETAIMNDPEISSARKCIFPANKLSGLNGLDEDLTRIIESNPSHVATVQYLGCLYLLLKDDDYFMAMLDDFMAKGYIQAPLPSIFQEAVIISEGADPETVAKYGISDEVLRRYEKHKTEPNASRGTYWYYHNII